MEAIVGEISPSEEMEEENIEIEQEIIKEQ